MPIDWRRRERAARFDHGRPLLRASSLPFAILFSTLGLLFLFLWRPPYHAVVIDVPVTSGLGQQFEPWPDDLPRHILRLSPRGQIWWDDNAINQPILVRQLNELISLQEGLIFKPDGNASYDQVAKTLNIIAASGVASYSRFCLAGMAGHRQFGTEGSPRLMLTLIRPSEKQLPFFQRSASEDCEPANAGPDHTHIRLYPPPPPA